MVCINAILAQDAAYGVALPFARYRVTKVPSVMVWSPFASIANTSKGCPPGAGDSTNSRGSVTSVLVAGRVT
jgi:hypothetical protein